MCKTYNLIGSLAAIKSHLLRHNMNEFNSLNEVISFQKNYFSYQQEIISNQKILIEKEKSMLFSEISQLDATIKTRKIEIEKELRLEIDKFKQQLREMNAVSTGILKTFANYFKKHFIKNKICTNELNLNSKISHSIQHLASMLTKKNNRYQRNVPGEMRQIVC
jgi:hypothetical protein